jgi:5-hydroxyisourate hydrolase
MPQGISIHVVDVSRGRVASGMRIAVYALSGSRKLIVDGRTDARGMLADPALDTRFDPGEYEAHFHAAEFYRSLGIELPAVPFLDVVIYRFGIADPDSHYHLPFKLTPWGFSLFRGGA